jgi:hypothetical protein
MCRDGATAWRPGKRSFPGQWGGVQEDSCPLLLRQSMCFVFDTSLGCLLIFLPFLFPQRLIQSRGSVRDLRQSSKHVQDGQKLEWYVLLPELFPLSSPALHRNSALQPPPSVRSPLPAFSGLLCTLGQGERIEIKEGWIEHWILVWVWANNEGVGDPSQKEVHRYCLEGEKALRGCTLFKKKKKVSLGLEL